MIGALNKCQILLRPSALTILLLTIFHNTGIIIIVPILQEGNQDLGSLNSIPRVIELGDSWGWHPSGPALNLNPALCGRMYGL